jgi:Protein of unknown function (DUF2946)
MRRRLRKFLPIVLIALMVQILAPIGACWAASIAASDPLAAATICRDGAVSASGQADSSTDQTGGHHMHDGCCMACGSHAPATIDTPPHMAVAVPYRHVLRVVWHDAALTLPAFRSGAHAQARAPPSIS